MNLYAGAGGLAIGLRAAGFTPHWLYERDANAWRTLKENGLVSVDPPGWEDHRGDVRLVRWDAESPQVRLLAGGVPCQPFSLAGNHFADRDDRDMFPETTEAIRILQPQAFFLENVFGLLRESFRPYFEYIVRRLECVDVAPRRGEIWQDHDRRLIKHQRSTGYRPDYDVSWRCVDAADYGVPQNRRRVFIVGTRHDLAVYKFPMPTHSREVLKHEQAEGSYWKSRGLKKPDELPWSGRINGRPDGLKAWRTIYDALNDLPPPASQEPEAEEGSGVDINHWTVPGARSYPGHTGSSLHWTAKAIKAGVHGVPGGENTLRIDDDGGVRYFTLREAARIQTFPDRHHFKGARLHVTRQIGNAVPCDLVARLARPLFKLLSGEDTSR